MTLPDPNLNPNHDGSPPDANDPGDRCVRYLIGEMGPEESERFEQDLQRSPDLADKLMRSSDLVLGLALPGDSRPVSPPATSTSLPATQTSLPGTRATHPWRWSMAVAVAVGLLFVLLVWRPRLTPFHTGDEELRIAQAWVTLDTAEPNATDSDLDGDLPDGDLPDDIDAFDSSRSQRSNPLNTDSDSLDAGEATFDFEDGLPEWLLAAVSAELERDESPSRQAEGERNDG